jgi:hypothetical protein
MNPARTRLDAHSEFPKARPAWWNHSVSKSSAAAPDRKNIAHRRKVISAAVLSTRARVYPRPRYGIW